MVFKRLIHIRAPKNNSELNMLKNTVITLTLQSRPMETCWFRSYTWKCYVREWVKDGNYLILRGYLKEHWIKVHKSGILEMLFILTSKGCYTKNINWYLHWWTNTDFTECRSLKLGFVPGPLASSSGSSQPMVNFIRKSTDAAGFSWNDKRSRQGKEYSILTRSCLAPLNANNGTPGYCSILDKAMLCNFMYWFCIYKYCIISGYLLIKSWGTKLLLRSAFLEN